MEVLHSIYASTRTADMALFPWTDVQKAQFFRMQFMAQHAHYQAHYASASFDCVMRGDEVIGRLYVHRTTSQIRIVDISLLPQFRGIGTGSQLLNQLIIEASQTGRQLTAHVEHSNRARHWYKRQSFREIDDLGAHVLVAFDPRVVDLRLPSAPSSGAFAPSLSPPVKETSYGRAIPRRD